VLCLKFLLLFFSTRRIISFFQIYDLSYLPNTSMTNIQLHVFLFLTSNSIYQWTAAVTKNSVFLVIITTVAKRSLVHFEELSAINIAAKFYLRRIYFLEIKCCKPDFWDFEKMNVKAKNQKNRICCKIFVKTTKIWFCNQKTLCKPFGIKNIPSFEVFVVDVFILTDYFCKLTTRNSNLHSINLLFYPLYPYLKKSNCWFWKNSRE